MSDAHFTVRAVERSDVPAICGIERESFITPWSGEQLERDIFENPFSRYLCASRDGRVVGYAGIWLKMEEAHVMTLAVAAEERRMGAGGLLMRELISLAANSGCMFMELECRAGNDEALRLYKRLGFLRVGRRAGYYVDTGEDAIVMALLKLPEGDPNADMYIVNE